MNGDNSDDGEMSEFSILDPEESYGVIDPTNIQIYDSDNEPEYYNGPKNNMDKLRESITSINKPAKYDGPSTAESTIVNYSVISGAEAFIGLTAPKLRNKPEPEEHKWDALDDDFSEKSAVSVPQSIHNKGIRRQGQDSVAASCETIGEFVDISESQLKNLPANPAPKNALSYYKGVIRGGITNLNYMLHDKGFMKIVGVAPLEFDDLHPRVNLYNKRYNYKPKSRFLTQFQKIIWFTYRKNFTGLLNRKKFLENEEINIEELNKDRKIMTSDTGWGCMIRVAQMILARVFTLEKETEIGKMKIHLDYVKQSHGMDIKDTVSEMKPDEEETKREIIRLFLDNGVDKESPFGIQNFIEHSFSLLKKLPGDWYGVSSVSNILQSLNNHYKPFDNLEIIICNESGINEKLGYNKSMVKGTGKKSTKKKEEEALVKGYDVIDDFFKDKRLEKKDSSIGEGQLFQAESPKIDKRAWGAKRDTEDGDIFDFERKRSRISDNRILQSRLWQKHLFIIVNVRIGFEAPEEHYFPVIKDLFDIPFGVGMMGGKKNKALYFVGYQDDRLLFLDPHYEQESIPKGYFDDFSIESYSGFVPKTLDMKHLDTCLGIGFYVKTCDEFQDLKDKLKALKDEHKENNLVSIR